MVTRDTQSRTRSVTMVIDGVERQAASVTVSIRPGKSMTLSVDVPEDVTLTEEQRDEIADTFAGFMEEALAAAALMGVPVPALSAVD